MSKTARDVIAHTSDMDGHGLGDWVAKDVLSELEAAGFVIVPKADVKALLIYESAIKLIDEREHGPAVLVSHKAVMDVERLRKTAQERKP
jgi:hypothetical protein